MGYAVVYTGAALNDLREITTYIADLIEQKIGSQEIGAAIV